MSGSRHERGDQFGSAAPLSAEQKIWRLSLTFGVWVVAAGCNHREDDEQQHAPIGDR
jgi:hypothetical protein